LTVEEFQVLVYRRPIIYKKKKTMQELPDIMEVINNSNVSLVASGVLKCTSTNEN